MATILFTPPPPQHFFHTLRRAELAIAQPLTPHLLRLVTFAVTADQIITRLLMTFHSTSLMLVCRATPVASSILPLFIFATPLIFIAAFSSTLRRLPPLILRYAVIIRHITMLFMLAIIFQIILYSDAFFFAATL